MIADVLLAAHIPILTTMNKTHQAAQLSRAFTILRTGINVMRTASSYAAFRAKGLLVHPALRPALMCLIVLAFVFVALMSLERLDLWMTGAGLFMVVTSIISAVQEFNAPKLAQSYQDFLDENLKRCGSDNVTLPHLSPVTCSTVNLKQQNTQVDIFSRFDASPSIINLVASTAAPNSSFEPAKNSRGASEYSIGALESAVNTTTDNNMSPHVKSMTGVGDKKLDVLHCGTVIDLQGSRGFIIPHNLCLDAMVTSVAVSSDVANRSHPKKRLKMPLVVPFNLNEEEPALRQDIAVGKTVEFAYSETAMNSKSTKVIRALNVTPIPTDDGIIKSRSALQSCKQAREVSFARAMEELTMISPRNIPVKHRIDLIKYAEELDDHDDHNNH